MAEMEKRLETLSAMVSAQKTTDGDEQRSASPSLPPMVASAPPRAESTTIYGNPGEDLWTKMTNPSYGSDQLSHSRNLATISRSQLRSKLERYRVMSNSFPFVPISRGLSEDTMMSQRPLLMFAIAVATSSDDPSFQHALSTDFERVAITNSILRGHKTLDLLQALLVYLAWHHHYMNPNATSLYMLLQVCVGLIVELRVEDDLKKTRLDGNQLLLVRDRIRAFLGCFYLSCGINAMGLHKPGNLANNKHTTARAQDLVATGEYSEDRTILGLCQVLSLIEDMDSTLGEQTFGSDSSRHTSLQIRRLETHIEELLRGSSFGRAQTVNSLITATLVHLYQLGIDAAYPSVELKRAGSESVLLNMRTSCLGAMEDFLENALRIAPEAWWSINIVDWISLFSTLVLFGKLSKPSASMPGWDAKELRLSEKLTRYLEAFDTTMPVQYRQQSEAPEGLFTWFRRTSANMKKALQEGSRGPVNDLKGSTYDVTSVLGRDSLDARRGSVSASQRQSYAQNGTNGSTMYPTSDGLGFAFDGFFWDTVLADF